MLLNAKRLFLFIACIGALTFIQFSTNLTLISIWEMLFKEKKYILLINWEEFHEGKQKMVIHNEFHGKMIGDKPFKSKNSIFISMSCHISTYTDAL